MTGALVLDHVTLVVADGPAFGERLRAEHGLGWFPGGYLDHLGARSHNVPLTPPAYLEWLSVEDASVAAGNDTGRRLLDLRAAGGGVAAWTVLVPDIDAVARRVGVEVYDGTTRIETGPNAGVLRRWRTVTGPPHLPVFIWYEGFDARLERQRGAYESVGHTSAPGGYTRVEVGGDPRELAGWLGPHDLPVTFVDGPPGIVAAYVATARGEVRVP
ncbi:MAG TPA: VOC family protein [Frankiaceae bacterium]|nr:VOC family protein [Frankiaceae bacterium]